MATVRGERGVSEPIHAARQYQHRTLNTRPDPAYIRIINTNQAAGLNGEEGRNTYICDSCPLLPPPVPTANACSDVAADT